MKNITSKYIAILAALLFLASCNNYLDIVPKGSQLLATPQDFSNLMNYTDNIMYDSNDIRYLSDDCWVDPQVLDRAKDAPTIVNISFLWLTGDPVKYDRPPQMSLSLYQSCYQRISKVANLILDNIDAIDGDAQEKEQVKAEAKMLRAYNYFVLINVFAKHYNPATANTDGGVPLRLTFDLTAKAPIATVAQVYEVIEKDIEEALPYLSNTPANNFHFSKAAGYALKAKVHLFKKEFGQAKAAALESYALNHQVTDIITYFDRGKMDKISAFVPENLYYAAAEARYIVIGAALIAQGLIDIYRENGSDDIRFSGFFDYPSSNGGDDKNFSAQFNVNNNTLFAYNTSGLRTTEVMLILAECYAREGDFANMEKYLDEVRVKRIKNYVPGGDNPVDKTDAVNIVIKERRKELLFGFNRFWDLRRLNTEPEFAQTLSRTAPANPSSTIFTRTTATIAPNSQLWVLPFPKAVIDQSIDPATGRPTIKSNVPY